MKQITMALALLLLGCGAFVQAQITLADKVAEGGVEWMIGDWEGTGDDRETVSLSFKWDLNKHVIFLHRKSARWESKGMNAVDPESGDVKFIGVTSMGGFLTGVWEDKDGYPLMKLTAKGADGRSWKGGIVYKSSGNATMEVEYYAANDAGDLEEPARGSWTFKKK